VPVAPTLVSFTPSATFDDWNSGSKSVTISWQTGDILVYMAGGSSSVALPIPTAAGLTFGSVKANSAASTSASQLATATAGAAGTSVTLTGTLTGGGSGNHFGFGVWIWRGSGGVGHSSEQHTTTKTVALTVTSADSGICWMDADVGGGTSLTPTPSPTHTQVNGQSGFYAWLYADITDQATLTAINYGTTTGSASAQSLLVVEILGASSAVANSGFFGFM
jgi:hypothetical protein